jgi:hypothetical protein
MFMPVRSGISSTLSVQQAYQGERHMTHSAVEHNVEQDLAPRRLSCLLVLVVMSSVPFPLPAKLRFPLIGRFFSSSS